MDTEQIIEQLRQQILEIEEELAITKEHLKKYTAPSSRKEYYENNKEAIKERNNKYKQTYKPTEEQKKKWARTAYLKKKKNI